MDDEADEFDESMEDPESSGYTEDNSAGNGIIQDDANFEMAPW